MASSVSACRNLEERRAVGPEEALWPPHLGRDGSAWKGMTKDFSFRASKSGALPAVSCLESSFVQK